MLQRTGGLFSNAEIDHINILEAKAAYFGLQALCPGVHDTHIKILGDNSATVGAINNMGSSKSSALNDQIHRIWEWAQKRENWITASHIPGVLNVEAGEESRKSEFRTEWKLHENVFQHIVDSLDYAPSVDLFASRINTQLPRFAAYRPDPEAEVIDAFTIPWGSLDFYAFSPFNCVDRVLQKVIKDGAKGILVAPNWANQVWYHMFMDLIVIDIYLPPRLDLLYLSNNVDTRNPLHHELGLRAALISGAKY